MAFSNILAPPRLGALSRERVVDLLIFLLIALFCWVAVESGRYRPRDAADYYQFWVVGQATRTMDVTNVYSFDERYRIGHHFLEEAHQSPFELAAARQRKVIEPCATPFYYALFKLVSTGDYDSDYDRFFGFSLFVYIASVYLLCRMSGFNALGSLLFTVYALNFFWPLRSDIRLGNVAEIQLALVVACLAALKFEFSRTGRFVSALLLAFGFFFKPNVVDAVILLGGTWVLIGDKKTILSQAAAFVLVGLVALAVPMIVFGSSCSWTGWLEGVPPMIYTRHYIKDSLPSILFDTLDLKVHRALTAAFLGGILFLVWKGKEEFAHWDRRKSRMAHPWRRDAYLVALGLCAYLLTDPFIHGQYFLLVLPMAILLIGDGFLSYFSTRGSMNCVAAAIGLLLISAHPVFPWHSHNTPARQLWNYAGTALLAAFGVLDLYRMSKPVADENALPS